MIKFYEYKQESGIEFLEGVNHFLKEKVTQKDILVSVKYQKFIEKGEPVSSVLIVVNEDAKKVTESKQKELVFFELNEHTMDIPQGKTFHDIINEEFATILNPEDDLYAVEYCKYFYKMETYSSVLILMNVSFG